MLIKENHKNNYMKHMFTNIHVGQFILVFTVFLNTGCNPAMPPNGRERGNEKEDSVWTGTSSSTTLVGDTQTLKVRINGALEEHLFEALEVPAFQRQCETCSDAEVKQVSEAPLVECVRLGRSRLSFGDELGCFFEGTAEQGRNSVKISIPQSPSLVLRNALVDTIGASAWTNRGHTLTIDCSSNICFVETMSLNNYYSGVDSAGTETIVEGGESANAWYLFEGEEATRFYGNFDTSPYPIGRTHPFYHDGYQRKSLYAPDLGLIVYCDVPEEYTEVRTPNCSVQAYFSQDDLLSRQVPYPVSFTRLYPRNMIHMIIGRPSYSSPDGIFTIDCGDETCKLSIQP